VKSLNSSQLQVSLIQWYKDNHRDLPWRRTKDPYTIWISEVMLQQTTVTAVLPYFHQFLKRFPNLESLAKAPLENILESWSGLGYYSRARNLHKAAQSLHLQSTFPTTFEKLLEFPGFGPYTARAVASFAFGQKVGVLDGNVIRLLSRLHNAPVEHWKPLGRDQLQKWSDELANCDEADIINQALIELGATLCSKLKPNCFLCPWSSSCQARKAGTVDQLPLKKPKAQQESWLWEPEIVIRGQKIGLVQNDHLPFLKGQWIFPGTSKKILKKPRLFDVKHGITKYDIYVKIKKDTKSSASRLRWVDQKSLKKINPTNLLQKILGEALK
jgi:A/G-specific adenine glycosylase